MKKQFYSLLSLTADAQIKNILSVFLLLLFCNEVGAQTPWSCNPCFSYCSCRDCYSNVNTSTQWQVTALSIGTLNATGMPCLEGCAYALESQFSGSVTQGQTYNLQVTVNSVNFLVYETIMIDWNGNGVLDAGEEVVNNNYVSGSTVANYSITVPSNAFVGTVRMRVYSCNDQNIASLCNTAYTGECKDFNLTVLAACPLVAPGGPDNVCQSASPPPITLSGASFGGTATSAAWSILSGGGTLSSIAQTARPDTITYLAVGSYSGTVTLLLSTNNPTGCYGGGAIGATGERTIHINVPPTVTAGGPNNVCQSASPSAFALSGASVGGGATSAAWSITSGGGSLSTTAQVGTPSSVTYTPAANYSGTVILTLTSGGAAGCTVATGTRTINVNARPTPTFTTQPGANACAFVDVTYTTQAGESNYAWTYSGTLNTDYSITSGGTSTSNSVTLKWLTTTGSKTVSVNYTNASGCNAASPITSTATMVVNCTFYYTVKFFLQGYYLGANAMSPLLHLLGATSPTVVDTVSVEFHRSTAPYDSIYAIRDTVSANGTISDSLPGFLLGGSYYIVVKHRNSIDTWSGSAVTLLFNGAYDFTTGAIKAYGNNMINLGGGVYGIYSGDVNKDGVINKNDKTVMKTKLSAISIGLYDVNDITGDGIVDEEDYRILQNNLGIIARFP